MFALINTLLIALCIFIGLLGWLRSIRRRQAHYEAVLRQPATREWLAHNLSGQALPDIRAAARRFGISRAQAKQLIDGFRRQ